MSDQRVVGPLGRLVAVREAGIDRLKREFGRKEALRERYRTNLRTMQQLFDEAGKGVGTACAELSLNRLGYRQGLLDMIAAHREALQLHEADMAVDRQRLLDESVRCEIWRRELQKREATLDLSRERRAQRVQDELAAQTRYRGGRM
ncbi:hypothetical protein [Pandoraea pulmonicola]|uniref:Flagellar export protein FliJ n=1 Tax=Pandoraea pulmonicola TaxID=93221 RepID=A0AAJ4ZB68_PANPU|nr:hypothetical protein [Pandoraea pulmonicola]AJC21217.1 hypothetical protein RO07_13325 [Pandoraea pulmonicola]SUA90101.1 flagellar export protein FliJ [Pandoraea pulmonicola]